MLACQPPAGGSVLSRWVEHFLLFLSSQEERDAIGIQVFSPRPEHKRPLRGSQGPQPCRPPGSGCWAVIPQHRDTHHSLRAPAAKALP